MGGRMGLCNFRQDDFVNQLVSLRLTQKEWVFLMNAILRLTQNDSLSFDETCAVQAFVEEYKKEIINKINTLNE